MKLLKKDFKMSQLLMCYTKGGAHPLHITICGNKNEIGEYVQKNEIIRKSHHKRHYGGFIIFKILKIVEWYDIL